MESLIALGLMFGAFLAGYYKGQQDGFDAGYQAGLDRKDNFL